jgi:hypothetical protein
MRAVRINITDDQARRKNNLPRKYTHPKVYGKGLDAAEKEVSKK